jgi:DNA-binding MarR family transcriptional regulator
MEFSELTSQIQIVLNQVIFLEKKGKFTFDGISLHPSEIHLMLETKGDQAVNATKIAEKLRITKGAVSQTLARLENKGIITKIKDPYYKNELSIILTPLGKKVYNQYQIIYEQIKKDFENILTLYSKDELDVITSFLSQIDCILKTI